MTKFDCGSNKVYRYCSMVWPAAMRSVEKPTRFGVGECLIEFEKSGFLTVFNQLLLLLNS